MKKIVAKTIVFIGVVAFASYLFSMVVLPWVESGGDWKYVQAVWERWQGFNTGVLAFFAAALALYVSYRSDRVKQKQRDWLARVKLVLVLGRLNKFGDEVVEAKKNIVQALAGGTKRYFSDKNRPRLSVVSAPPEDIQAIVHLIPEVASDETRNALTLFVLWYQIDQARFKDLVDWLNGDSDIAALGVMNELIDSVLLKALMRSLYAYGRGGVSPRPMKITDEFLVETLNQIWDVDDWPDGLKDSFDGKASYYYRRMKG